jgi:hypothetical protein
MLFMRPKEVIHEEQPWISVGAAHKPDRWQRPFAPANSVSTLLIFLFTYTATSKLFENKGFVAVLQRLPLVERGAGAIAVLLPVAELFIVLLLIFERTRLKGLYASLLLLSVFTGYLLYMVLYVPGLPCSCGGVIGRMGWRTHIIFNLIFIGLTLAAIRSNRHDKGLGRWNRRSG